LQLLPFASFIVKFDFINWEVGIINPNIAIGSFPDWAFEDVDEIDETNSY
jgi:hypothetical protein